MAIGIICRHCGARLKVAEKAAGKLGKCPKCKNTIRVPQNVSPQAHFCDRCEKTLAEEPDIHLVAGKIYCGDCFSKIGGKKQKTGDPILDEIGLNIPGMVVLRGTDQRKMGRMLQDVSAKKDYKEKAGGSAVKTPAKAGESEKTQHEDEPISPEEAAAAGIAVEFPAAEPFAAGEPAAEPEEEPAKKEEPAPPPEKPEEEAPVIPVKLGKGQRPADPFLTKLLVEKGVVLDGELELAIQYQTGLGKRLIPVLDDLKLTSEEEVARTIAESSGLERCPPGELDIAVHAEDILDDEIMNKYEVVPLSRESDTLIAAFPNPLDTSTIKGVTEAAGMRVIPRVCTWSQYTEARHALKARS